MLTSVLAKGPNCCWVVAGLKILPPQCRAMEVYCGSCSGRVPSTSLERPAAVFFDHDVDLGHEADGFGEGDDDFLVVGEVVLRELPSFAVFEPFLADLVAADVEVPHVLAHASEAGGLRLVQPNGVFGPPDFFDLHFAPSPPGS